MLQLDRPTSSITQLESGLHLEAEEFTNNIQSRSEEFKDKYFISQGSVVLILECNSINFFINLLAIFKLGATAIPFHPEASDLEKRNIITHAGVNVIISESEVIYLHKNSNEELKNIALVLYTSGTTGKPKGVKLSYDALKSKIEVLSRIISPEEGKNTLCFLPTYFGHGLICNSLYALFNSRNFVIAKKLDLLFANEFKTQLNKFEITFFSSVPSAWELILNFSDNREMPIPSLRRVHTASSILKNEKAQAIYEWLGKNVSFYNIFGITEMSGWFSHSKYSPNSDPSIFQEFWDSETQFTQEGELLIKAPFMFSGYLDNPEETKKALNDGFFRTGDLFINHKYVGRLKLVINKKGIKIYPTEIDEYIMSSGMVNDCHTFAIKDKYAGEIIGVLLVMKESFSVESLREFCQKGLPPNKFPDRLFPVDKIERTNRGKIALESLNKYLEGKES